MLIALILIFIAVPALEIYLSPDLADTTRAFCARFNVPV